MKFQSIGKAALPFAMMAGLGMSQAQAADLGGDCCADLEERIAELEATTVRKGNRVVSVKLSGQVNTGVLYWDDGVENNVYVVDNTTSSTRFRLTGSANIVPGWTAGFHLEFEVTAGATSAAVNQLDDDGGQNSDARPDIRQAHWWIKSDHLGKLAVGQLSPATDDLVYIDLGGTGVVSLDTNLWGGGFLITQGNVHAQKSVAAGVNNAGTAFARSRGSTTVGTIFTGFDSTNRSNAVRYDTPTLAGFTLSAAWGEDDIWDVAVRYAGEHGPIRVAFGIGYFEGNDDTTGRVNGSNRNRTDTRFKGSASVMYVPVGVFLSGFWNYGDDDPAAGTLDQDTERWGLRAGIRQKFLPLGQTTVYVGYQFARTDNTAIRIDDNDADNNNAVPAQLETAGVNLFTGNQEGEQWEVGVVQRIDAAAMELYLAYKNMSFDIRDDANNARANANDQHYVFGGARIKF